MEMLLVNAGWGESVLKALCWTFIHSLWQGLGYSLAAGAVLLLTRRSAPALRYNLIALILLCFVATTGVTMYLLFPGTTAPAAAAPLVTGQAATVAASFRQQFAAYCDSNAPLLVLCWFIIFMIKFLKMIAGLAYIRRIRSYGVYPPGDHWNNKVKELAGKLQISAPVKLLESMLVKVPVVTGWLKPVIMLPLGLMAELPEDQVEAILLHELAHIRRKDYFVNLLQSFVEIFFFFNPAVYWLSALLREEREHCCDDLAVHGSNNKATYIKALVAFQEYRLGVNDNPAALAFAESKHQLLERVKRMVYNHNKNLNIKEKLFLATGVFILAAIALAPVAKTQAQKHGIWPPADTIKGVIQPIRYQVPAIKPDNRQQHITEGSVTPAHTRGNDTMLLRRQQEQAMRELQQQERDKLQQVHEQQQQERNRLDSIRYATGLARQAADAKREREVLQREEEIRQRSGDTSRNVSRDVPPTKPVNAIAPVSPVKPRSTNN
ncbi:Signal transducer regulating beta-lactamase production, contains metallopeptidase domain [Chitinophaga terrae (ex Kim and Jung 2007)]|uniref:Signal transducer regulating beta-lactamase production, contains metallopeptidase domain n=1 Tax=Chitinophaga terrae (ex Kim and Jung 2007) TaxID=408074 RepID=A0A1H4D4T7_9BACT|nr:M56 family metallopeptidase [Chitinophaga terrae (ex Kim and Jung 2007)]MDQ0108395.1 beta-lactamase regulating signal transducer with metallopeptidase domain [Chitinophaga terrae (ex Kim and Jung 2007)]GEP90566.1 hypothetical protein CTE07_22110 [Chitinophaga terrae (ex Kim and Jung 2007)]SEA67449.1 Signal transducer regulating beta-lactamase production, contains metallopeptidase domain [Chitinophaga terrae (ex Kim and Jung 2007)]